VDGEFINHAATGVCYNRRQRQHYKSILAGEPNSKNLGQIRLCINCSIVGAISKASLPSSPPEVPRPNHPDRYRDESSSLPENRADLKRIARLKDPGPLTIISGFMSTPQNPHTAAFRLAGTSPIPTLLVPRDCGRAKNRQRKLLSSSHAADGRTLLWRPPGFRRTASDCQPPARESTAPIRTAVVAKACFRRAATDWAGMKLPSAVIKARKPFATRAAQPVVAAQHRSRRQR
jgi:hypothetical protein